MIEVILDSATSPPVIVVLLMVIRHLRGEQQRLLEERRETQERIEEFVRVLREEAEASTDHRFLARVSTLLPLNLRPKPDSVPACVLCRETVEEHDWRCRRCGTVLHRVCRKELDSDDCPILGCHEPKEGQLRLVR